ncbi:MAG: DUF2442 domain-containing protein [Verrucomicrobia bacterium]|nr:DUF2442 domain-containing protein [Verrucomicrobiota bacterium]
MHYITGVQYDDGYALLLTFDDDSVRRVDLECHLDGEIFEPLGDIEQFRTAHLNQDIDTVVWANGADMSPDFLYEISEPVDGTPLRKMAEGRATYDADHPDAPRPNAAGE